MAKIFNAVRVEKSLKTIFCSASGSLMSFTKLSRNNAYLVQRQTDSLGCAAMGDLHP